jgi:TolB-like protein
VLTVARTSTAPLGRLRKGDHMETASPKLTTCPTHMSRLSVGRCVCVGLITGLLILTARVPAKGQDRQFQDLSAQLAQKISKSGKKSVAVVDFTDLQGNVTELGRYLAEELSVSLAQQANGFTVIDRTYLKAILRENKLDASGLIDPATATKLGQIAGVQGLITGTIVPLGDNVSLSIKVLDATTEAILAATITQIPRTEAINSLLRTGISTGSVANGTTTGSGSVTKDQEGTPGAAQPTGGAVVHEQDLDFIVKGCRRDRGRVLCVGSVIDKASGELRLQVGEADFVDNLGDQCPINLYQQFVLGASGNDQVLEPDLPINFSLWADYSSQNAGASAQGGAIGAIVGSLTGNSGNSRGIDPRATSVSIILKGRYFSIKGNSFALGDIRNYAVTLRHILIQGK